MNISTFLSDVGNNYDRHEGLGTDTQRLLRGAADHFEGLLPGRIEVRGSGGKGIATLTPWVGFFDPDGTSSPEEGIYVVYLFSADLAKVNLMLLQGVTLLTRRLGAASARAELTARADAIRDRLPRGALAGLSRYPDLASDGPNQQAYTASCVAALVYELAELPAEEVLRNDLARFWGLYQQAIAVKRGSA